MGGRAAAAERCRGGCRGGWLGCSSHCISLHARATAANGGGVFRSMGRVRGARWAASAAHGAAEWRPSGCVACVACACRSRLREIGGTESPERLRGGSGRSGPGLAVPHGPSGVDRGVTDPR